MAIIDILLPKMGESVAEATITKLVVDAGAGVEADEPIVEIATDKVDSEVPAPEDGTLVEWCVAEGDVVQVGAVIARYNVGGEAADAAPAPSAAAAPSAPTASVAAAELAPAPEMVAAAMAPLDNAPSRKGPSGRFYSPLVRSIAQKEGIGMAELEQLQGTGFGGSRHQERHLGVHRPARTNCARGSPCFSCIAIASRTSPCQGSTPAPAPKAGCSQRGWRPRHRGDGPDAQDDCRPHGAQRADEPPCHLLCRSRRDQPRHVAQRQQKDFQEKYGEKLTFTPLIAEAIVKAIRDFPASMPVWTETRF